MNKEIQSEHSEFRAESHNLDIVMVADNFNSPENYGMLIRMAESMGVKRIFFISEVYDSLSTKMLRSARSAQYHIEIRFFKSAKEVLEELQNSAYQIIALEQTNQSKSLYGFELNSQKIAVILGNERYGVSQDLLNACNHVVHIPMYGRNSSMNVVMAAGIALYHFIHK